MKQDLHSTHVRRSHRKEKEREHSGVTETELWSINATVGLSQKQETQSQQNIEGARGVRGRKGNAKTITKVSFFARVVEIETFRTVIQDYFCLYNETSNSWFTIGSRNLNVIWLFFEPFLLNLNSFSKTQKLDFSFPKYILEVVFVLLFSHKCLVNYFYCVYNSLNVLIPRYLWSRKTCCREPWKWHHHRFSNRIQMYLFNH